MWPFTSNPVITDKSGYAYISDNGIYVTLTLCLAGKNLDKLNKRWKATFQGRTHWFETTHVCSTIAHAKCDFNLHFEPNTPPMEFKLKTKNLQLRFIIEHPNEFFQASSTVHSLLKQAYKIRKLQTHLDNEARSSNTSDTIKTLDFPPESGWEKAMSALKKFEEMLSKLSSEMDVDTWCTRVQCALTKDVKIELRDKLEVAKDKGGVAAILLIGVGYATEMVGPTAAATATAALAALTLLKFNTTFKTVPETITYDLTLIKLFRVVKPGENLKGNFEDELAAFASRSPDSIESLLNINVFTKETIQEVARRIKLVLLVRDIRMFLSNCAIIGVFGMQQAGKTTTVRRLVQHAARSITTRELTSNTSFPVPYQEGNVHVIDFPGMGGAGNDFDKYTHLYGEICQAVLVVLPPEFSLTDAEVKLLTLVKTFERRTLVLRHRWGEKTGLCEKNYSDVKAILKNQQDHEVTTDSGVTKKPFQELEFCMTEFNGELWERAGQWLKDCNVWDIKRVRDWIRYNTVIRNRLDHVMPQSNAVWSTDKNRWIDEISPFQLFWNSPLSRRDNTSQENNRLMLAFKSLRGHGIADEDLVNFRYLIGLDQMREFCREDNRSFKILECQIALESHNGHARNAYRELTGEKR